MLPLSLVKSKKEGAPLSRLRLHPDRPTVALDFFANRQSGAGPLKIFLIVESLKETEDLLRVAGLNADTIISDREVMKVSLLSGGDLHDRSPLIELDGV